MGKKSRAKAAHQLEREIYNAKLEQKKKEQKKTTTTVIVSVCAVLLAVALIFGAVAAVTGSGVLLRGTVSISSENFEVDNAMLSYFFYNEFYNYLEQNSATAQKSLTSILSLKDQYYSDSLTWFDYIMGRAANNAAQYLMYAEAAKADGITLGDDDYAEIDANIANLEASAKEAGVSLAKYISASYGRGVKEDDIRRALEIIFLSDNKNQAIIDSISFTSDEKAKYFDDNKDKFTYISYKTFEMSAEDYYAEDNMPEDAELNVSTMATMLGASRSVEEFDQKVKDYLTQAYKNQGKELSEDELNNLIDATLITNASKYSDAFSDWAFKAERAVGDTTVITENGTHTAYLITETAHRLDYTTKNIYQILLANGNYENDDAAKAAAEKLLAEWKAGEATEASFETLASEKNEGASIGLASHYENLNNNTGLSEFDEWIYDSARKAGDTGIVKTYYGYHIIYFAGDGMAAWEAEVDAAMTNEEYQKAAEAIEKAYVITYNESKYDGVSGEFPSL